MSILPPPPPRKGDPFAVLNYIGPYLRFRLMLLALFVVIGCIVAVAS